MINILSRNYVPITGTLVIVTLGISGCTSAPPHVNADRGVEQITGTPTGLVSFRQIGEQDDVVPTEPAAELSLTTATGLAVQRDPRLQAALARVRSALADARQARLLPNPVLNVGVHFPKGNATFIDAGLSEDITSLLSRPGRVNAADARLRVTAAEALSTALDVLGDVQERYAAVQADDAMLPVLDERRKLLDRLTKLAQDRLTQGEGTRLDLTTIDAQRLDLEVEINEKVLDAKRNRLDLARLLGQPGGAAEWRLTEQDDPAPLSTVSEKAWVTQALRKRPEVQSQHWELSALGAEAAYSRLAAFDGLSAGVEAEQDSKWAVGPSGSIPVPLFDTGRERRAKADALVAEASHRLTQTRRQVIKEVREAVADYESSLATLRTVRDQLVPVQQRRRADAEAAYRAGQTDVTALILAEQDLQAARAKLVELRQRAMSASLRLQRTAGGTDAGPATAPAAPLSSAPSLAPSIVRVESK